MLEVAEGDGVLEPVTEVVADTEALAETDPVTLAVTVAVGVAELDADTLGVTDGVADDDSETLGDACAQECKKMPARMKEAAQIRENVGCMK